MTHPFALETPAHELPAILADLAEARREHERQAAVLERAFDQYRARAVDAARAAFARQFPQYLESLDDLGVRWTVHPSDFDDVDSADPVDLVDDGSGSVRVEEDPAGSPLPRDLRAYLVGPDLSEPTEAPALYAGRRSDRDFSDRHALVEVVRGGVSDGRDTLVRLWTGMDNADLLWCEERGDSALALARALNGRLALSSLYEARAKRGVL